MSAVARERPVGVREAERSARAVLAAATDPGDPLVGELVRSVGAEPALRALENGDVGWPGAARYRRRLALTDPDALFADTRRVGARVVVPGDLEWPARLVDLDSVRSGQGWGGCPVALWVRGPGDLARTTARSVALVGSREATAYGCSVAASMAAGLVELGWSVVSGGAYGIDGAAHRGALAAAGSTVAVLAGGVDVPYPRGNEALLGRVAEQGVLVSEAPPGAAPTRRAFLIRNRLIAALTGGTVVVEAALRSGALNTATWASGCLRVVMAVPGPVTSPLSAGTHRLLRDAEAVLVGDAAEVAATVGASGAGDEEPAPPPPAAELGRGRDPRDGLDEDALRVLDALAPIRATGLARVLALTGLSPGTALAVLGRLGAEDVVEAVDTGWRLSASTRAWNRRRRAGD